MYKNIPSGILWGGVVAVASLEEVPGMGKDGGLRMRCGCRQYRQCKLVVSILVSLKSSIRFKNLGRAVPEVLARCCGLH